MAVAHDQKHRRDRLTDWISRHDPHAEVRAGMDARPNGSAQPNGAFDPAAARGPFAGASAEGLHHGVHAQMGNGKDDAYPWDPRFDDVEPAGERYRGRLEGGADSGIGIDVGRAFLWAAFIVMAGVFSFRFFSGFFS